MIKYALLFALCFADRTPLMAQLPEKSRQRQIRFIEKELELGPYIRKIKSGEIAARRASILYAILQNTFEVCIHQQHGAKHNKVYVHQDGHSEAVYDEDGKLVQDGVNDGSYNYFHPSKEPLRHFTFDISPWIMLGQSGTDNTTVESRIYAYMGDLEGGIRRAASREQGGKDNWKNDGQLQALAIFVRAIEEGEAESLYALFEPDAELTDKQLYLLNASTSRVSLLRIMWP